jgi:hypothetical protein
VVAILLLASASAPDGGSEAPVADAAAAGLLRERADAAQAPSRSALRAAPPTFTPAQPRSRAVQAQASPPPVPRSPAGGSGSASAPEPEPDPPAGVSPVGGLSQVQIDHAATIVAMGQRAGLPEYAYVIAIATALQESNLRNLANPTVPESLNHPHDGTGTDHDSVGLFQQRYTTGWGTVAQIMDPSYAATKFYQALASVPGWESMAVTIAAQTVQRSAFPDAYAKHEPLARQVVAALT